MTKKQKKELAEKLRKQLNVANVKFTETSNNAAWCLGYLEGTIQELIHILEE